MSKGNNYYDFLNLHWSASDEQIKHALRELRLQQKNSYKTNDEVSDLVNDNTILLWKILHYPKETLLFPQEQLLLEHFKINHLKEAKKHWFLPNGELNQELFAQSIKGLTQQAAKMKQTSHQLLEQASQTFVSDSNRKFYDKTNYYPLLLVQSKKLILNQFAQLYLLYKDHTNQLENFELFLLINQEMKRTLVVIEEIQKTLKHYTDYKIEKTVTNFSLFYQDYILSNDFIAETITKSLDKEKNQVVLDIRKTIDESIFGVIAFCYYHDFRIDFITNYQESLITDLGNHVMTKKNSS